MAEKKKTVKRKGLGRAPEKAVVKKTEGSARARKTAARLAAVQVLYQMRLNNQDARSAVGEFAEHRIGYDLDGDLFVPADRDMLLEIVMGAASRAADIDAIVGRALADGKKGGVETLLDAILRAGVYELLACGHVDAAVIINDYLNITAGFYAGAEPKIVNAILDRVAKSVRDKP